MSITLLKLFNKESKKERFIRFYTFYNQFMFYTAQQILNDEQLSEEAVQNAFIKIIEKFDKINNDFKSKKTKAYVITITRNSCIDILRRNNENYSSDILPDIESSTGKFLLGEFKTEYIVEAIRKLPLTYQQLLIVQYFHEMCTADISDMLNMSYTDTQKSLKHANNTLIASIIALRQKREHMR